MSFSGTPLGQGRRLDHHTFLNKTNPNLNAPASRSQKPPSQPERAFPTSYAYGAPTQGTRSPPKKPLSASSSREQDNSADDPALVRFSRQKEREQGQGTTADPSRWNVKDTSVQIANAFHQAADDMAQHNPNESWASAASGSGSRNLPRSTSVEYESQTRSTTERRLGAPRSRLNPPAAPSSGASRKPLSKQQSVKYVPDSEDEGAPPPEKTRGKSPFDSVVDVARKTVFYLSTTSQEQEPVQQPQEPSTNGYNNASYDYAAEEREYQKQTADAKRAAHKRGRMSVDNKAYRPSLSDLEQSDEDISDDGKKRRRKAKKGSVGGPLTSLPVTQYEKRRRRKKGSKADGTGGGEDEEGESGSEELVSEQRILPKRTSPIPIDLPRPPSRLRGSVPPAPLIPFHEDMAQLGDTSLDDYEQGLHSISENDEGDIQPHSYRQSSRSASIGGLLGRLVHFALRLVLGVVSIIFRLLAAIMGFAGRVLGGVFELLVQKPARLLNGANSAPLAALFKYLIVVAIIYVAWGALRKADLSSFLPSRPSAPYQAPDIPAGNIAEISARLQALENALAGLSIDSQQDRARLESSSRTQSEVVGRLGALETRLQKEGVRAVEERNVDRASATQGLQAVRYEMDSLRDLVKSVQHSEHEAGKAGIDEEARAKLAAIEARIGSVEGGVREALELGHTAAKVGGVASAGAAWWNKVTSSKKGLTIKSSDGQDVSELIGHLVDSAVSHRSKDTLAKPDFALHSGGASIIPSLTSPTLEVRPPTFRQQLLGLITNNGYAIGRAPIVALHHETNNGYCWPFAGNEGQLGVLLAHPVRIDEVAIDHVAQEIAWDMRSAPRKMEVWGLVEGADNLRKVAEWEHSRAQKASAEELEPLPEYPKTLPRTAKYVRVAQFEYDIAAPDSVQTFPVAQEIKDLGIDFGLVVLRIRSNWGREFTCLYRLRVHGQKLEQGIPDVSEESGPAEA
ncbi:hypothetical protein FA95DRAFT_207587 [Auriscalpium vulgare]|uniref:Uncharacterized protein n=1 Tax=Auriscalpium vulgare TaxID=40419 RepID=A0ACB8RMQ3_9AGAM|nr:hypothetical protein FA95DRAFT_207587 [Auriscalpium vulgare]